MQKKNDIQNWCKKFYIFNYLRYSKTIVRLQIIYEEKIILLRIHNWEYICLWDIPSLFYNLLITGILLTLSACIILGRKSYFFSHI